MPSVGAVDLIVVLVFVVLALDSRRLHALARSTSRRGQQSIRGHGIPGGASPDEVGLPLRQIQMRQHVDWEDGGLGWEGPEILPVDDPDVAPVGDPDGPPAGPDTTRGREPSPALPVLWNPFPALPAASTAGYPT